MRTIILVLVNLLILTAMPVQAEEVGKAVAREGISAAFEELERQMIYKYFKENTTYVHEHEEEYEHDDGDSGKAKKGKKKGLPPGIQKKLDRGGTLPPGIAKRYLPDDLHNQLPPAPPGYERTIVGSDVLLVEIDTGAIADIVTDAILGD